MPGERPAAASRIASHQRLGAAALSGFLANSGRIVLPCVERVHRLPAWHSIAKVRAPVPTSSLLRLALVALSIQLASCKSKDDAASKFFGTVKPRHGPQELWINNATEPEWLDPGRISGAVGGELAQNLFAGLVDWHPATLEPIGELATGYTVSDDGKIYTFALRESVWSDGVPVTAHDFEWSWKRVLDPKTLSKYASLLYFFENAKAFNQRALHVTGASDPAALRARVEAVAPVQAIETSSVGAFVYLGGEADTRAASAKAVIAALDGRGLSVKIAEASVVGVRAVDDLHLEVRLVDPLPFFISVLPFYTFLPVPRHVLERLEASGQNPDLWTRPEHLVTNGAYLLREWKFRQFMTFEKNPRYWDVASVRTPKVRISMVESYNTALNLYRAGEMDWIGSNANLPAEFMDHLRKFRDFHNDPKLAVYWYWMNTAKKPLDDRRVRRALSLAVDRAALAEHVLRGGQPPTANVVPDGLAGYDGLRSPIYDVARAQALLAEAGFPGGEGWPTISITYNTSESHKQIAEAIQQMWKKNLGISVEIENQEWKVYLKNLEAMGFDIGRLGWNGDYADPFTFLEIFTAASGNNHSNWSDPDYERLLTEANAARDPAERLALLRQAEAILVEEAPVMPLYVYTRPYMMKPYVKGLWGNFMDRHQWKYLWIDARWYDGLPATQVANDPPAPRRLVRN